MQTFIDKHVDKVKPLFKEANLAHWTATNSGKTEDYDKLKELELTIRKIYSDKDDYAFLAEMKKSGEIEDPPLRRQLELLYNGYLENQIEPDLLKQIVELDTEISQRFHTFRATLDDKKVTLNEINDILTTEKDSGKRERAWRASKQVGVVVADDLIRLIQLRNQAAHTLGFDDYRALSLTTGEQDPAQLDRIFAELHRLTNEPFARVKKELDAILAEQYGIEPAQLMPWHYHDPFFQRAPLVYEQDLDAYYEKVDVKSLAQRFYAGIGLPVGDVLARSDLYERDGKDAHAYSTDIDREGDVRILCNLENDEQWMETLLHELGHAVYSKYHDRREPFLLRTAAHAFTTEGVAMFFGRLSRNADWMQEIMNLSEEQRAAIASVSRKYARLQQLVFARWAMVMYQFEKQLYADPQQDFDTLWWETVEKYQLLRRPADAPKAAWASKLHFTVAPCYYHNYMLGELFASQMHHHIVHEVLGLQSDEGLGYVGQEKVGEFFRKEVFAPGALYRWNDLMRRATGDPLTPKFFVNQFVE